MRVAVAMSGGVDSLRTAALLKEDGHDVFGVHMHILPSCEDGRECSAGAIRAREEPLRALASRLGMPIVFLDLRELFEKTVIRPFLEAYRAGLTPNPCTLCNPKVKFGYLYEEARRLGAERLATGHYVALVPPGPESNRFRLCRGKDARKDQSYFLYGLTQEQLAGALFPLGGATKKETVQWAQENGFGLLIPDESQEICFIPSGRYSAFLQEKLGLSPKDAQGPIVNMEGQLLGVHQGIFSYTIGQRRGLGIASSAPYYVVNLDPVSNSVQVGRDNDLYRREVNVEAVNWVSIAPPVEPIHCQVRIRNQHRPAPALVCPQGEREASVCFEESQRAVTPGQAAVFYADSLLLGGGVIAKDPPPAGACPETSR